MSYGPWFPVKGDTLKPVIQTRNWNGDGQIQAFACGTFQVDDFSFSGGPPIRLSLEGLALPADSSFKTTQRTLTYEDATLQEIGQEIAGRAGIALFYEADTISIKRIEQTNQSDCEFYNKLVTDYGLVLKIYDNRLVVFSEAQYEAKAAKLTLTEADFEPGWSWDTTLEGTYTGIKYQYTNADQNKTFTVEAGSETRCWWATSPTAPAGPSSSAPSGMRDTGPTVAGRASTARSTRAPWVGTLQSTTKRPPP